MYKQIDGLAMGSPLAPLLANWFVAMIENKLLCDTSVNQPTFYRRYVDDIFAVFRCVDERDAFFEKLNKAHKNLSFTVENINTSTKSLPFLDVEVSISDFGKFTTKVYRKPTNTNVIMNNNAIAPDQWKVSLLKCFLLRAHKVSSSPEFFNQEVNKIQKIFESNGYSDDFVRVNLERCLKQLKEPDNKTRAELDGTTCDSKKAFLVLPFIGKCSIKLHQRIQRVMQKYNIVILRAFRTTKVATYFSLKTKIPDLFKKDVVYKFQCPCDKGTQYYGETERQFYQRIKEHCTPSATSKSAILDHLLQCNGCGNTANIVNCFSIVKQCTKMDILSQEALYIKRFQPSLNTQMGPFKGSRVGISIFT